MKPLKQQLQEKTVICYAANKDEILMLDPKDVPEIIKEWLTEEHKEFIEKIQYEELDTNEVIPLLLKRLEK